MIATVLGSGSLVKAAELTAGSCVTEKASSAAVWRGARI